MKRLLPLRALDADDLAAWLTALLEADVKDLLTRAAAAEGLPDPFHPPADAALEAGEVAERVTEAGYRLGYEWALRRARLMDSLLPSGAEGRKLARDLAHTALLARVAEGVEAGRIRPRQPGEPQAVGPWLGALGAAAVRYGLAAGLRLLGLGEWEASRN